MGLEIYGIAASQKLDNVGETLMIDGLDDSRMRILSDEHGDDDGILPFFRIVGAIKVHKKIHNELECTDEYQRRCWRSVQLPFLYVEGELADDTGHPDAQSAAALIKFCQRPEVPLALGLSIEGGIMERGGADNKQLTRTLATGAALTVKPANESCRLFIKSDLRKSMPSAVPPARYFEALRKSQATSSVYEIAPELMVYYKLESLKKSLLDYAGGFTEVRCNGCGKGMRFFKAGKVPNGCQECGENFSLSQIWKALNK
jgi:ribosomal protein S27E